jgi:hypothetical protein
VSPIGDTVGPLPLRGPIRVAVLASVALSAVAAVLGGTPGLAALALAASALTVAALLGMRSRWVASAPHQAPAVDVVLDGEGELPARLRRLHDEHVEQVNLALDEGRDDLVSELSDAYTDQALTLITVDAEVRR